MMSFHIEDNGYEVASATDPIKGLAIAQSFKPDLIITDLDMGSVSGIELIRQVKSNEDIKDIPIIVLTGNVVEENRKEAKEAGAIGFITKPILPIRLIREIEKVFA